MLFRSNMRGQFKGVSKSSQTVIAGDAAVKSEETVPPVRDSHFFCHCHNSTDQLNCRSSPRSVPVVAFVEHTQHRDMAASGKNGLSQRKIVVLYLVAIVGPALGLLYLAFQSVRLQRQEIEHLTTRLVEDRLKETADALERRTWQLAEKCLADAASANFGSIAERVETPDQARLLRKEFNTLKAKHPIARYFFV